ncbi:MAG: hypothetical protein IJT11_01040 [Bacteroidaceae bacterium]|nr:hypothetical protein [Bacteroidaceae bacterium]
MGLQTLHEGKRNATARKAERYSKESGTPQQGKADATARKEKGNDIVVGTMEA